MKELDNLELSFDGGAHRYALVIVSVRVHPVTSAIVEADGVEVRGAALCVLRDERVRFTIAACDVVRVDGFTTHKAAADALQTQIRGNHGGSTVHVQEYASADRGRSVRHDRAPTTKSRGGPAEGIAFRIDEG